MAEKSFFGASNSEINRMKNEVKKGMKGKGKTLKPKKNSKLDKIMR